MLLYNSLPFIFPHLSIGPLLIDKSINFLGFSHTILGRRDSSLRPRPSPRVSLSLGGFPRLLLRARVTVRLVTYGHSDAL